MANFAPAAALGRGAALSPDAGGRAADAQRFTRDGSEHLEQHLAQVCDRVRLAVQEIIPEKRLEAVILGGGYGRGEGGVWRTTSGDQPYNDLEFYVCVRGHRLINRRRYEHLLHGAAQDLSAIAGVDVELKIISLAYLRHSEPSMFYYDLVQGHRWVRGNEELLCGCDHHREAGRLPISEATRLLMNRLSGALLARERLGRETFTAEDADFVGRNHAKLQLALGDAMLAAMGQYHWSCLERDRRLRELPEGPVGPWLEDVHRAHAEGVHFKLYPQKTHAAQDELRSRLEALIRFALVVWLWVENRRLDAAYGSEREYVLCPKNKYPSGNRWRHALFNLRLLGPSALFRHGLTRAPQERLVRALSALVWSSLAADPLILRRVQRELQTNCAAKANLTRSYMNLWRRLN